MSYKDLLLYFSYVSITIFLIDLFNEFINSNEFDLFLNSTNFTFKNIIYVFFIKINILFINRFLRDYDISYTNVTRYCLYKQKTLLTRTDVSNDLLIISIKEQLQIFYTESKFKSISIKLTYRRFEYVNKTLVYKIIN